MSIYKRGNIWWCHFFVAGKEYRQSLETTDRRKAINEEKDRVSRACDGKLVALGTPFARLTFAEAVDQYIADRKPCVEPRTHITETERGKIVKAKLGAFPIKKISAELIQAYMRDRKAAGKANATVNRELDVIRGVLKRAKLWAVLADEIKPLPIRENIGRVLPFEEKLQMTSAAKLRPEWQSVRLAMTIALNTTMRSSEVRKLRWSNIDLIGKSLVVGKSKTDAGERKIPLNSPAWLAVMELRERAKRLFGDAIQPTWYVFPKNADRKKPDPLQPVGSWRSAWRTLTRSVSCPECGQLQKPAQNCWRKSCKADLSKLKSATAGFRFHDLRHQAITELGEGGASDATIMAIAGHVSKKMMEHYSHARMAAKRNAVEALGRAGHSTVTAQNRLFEEDNIPQVIEKMVDETGVEPATSSLRTQGTDSHRSVLNYTVDPTKPIA
jgi:integrase